MRRSAFPFSFPFPLPPLELLEIWLLSGRPFVLQVLAHCLRIIVTGYRNNMTPRMHIKRNLTERRHNLLVFVKDRAVVKVGRRCKYNLYCRI